MNRILPIFLTLILSLGCFQKGTVRSNSQPIVHTDWTELLQKHVTERGDVDYLGFKQDSAQLNAYLDKLKDHHPNDKNWTRDEQMAFWINAYNAFTVKLIVDHYPVKSIKEIGSGPNIPFVNSPWDIKFFAIEGNEYDLNDLEHGILRPKFSEPRIHFAVNCASISCPRLWNKAYSAENLDQQLEQAARHFINNPDKNTLKESSYSVSKIFSWFRGDFKQGEESVIDFVNRYTETKIPSDATLEYLDYDWNLNELPNSQN